MRCGRLQPCSAGPLPGTWVVALIVLLILIVLVMVVRHARQEREDSEERATGERPPLYRFDDNGRIIGRDDDPDQP